MAEKPPHIDDYSWNYGRLGEALVEGEIRANSGQWPAKGIPLREGWTIIDGHEPDLVFGNLSHIPVRHLDIIIAVRTVIRAIVEVKTTSLPSTRKFKANGITARVLYEARKAGIPIYL